MRERIVAAAMKALDEQGIRFTMQELASGIGISKRTLYEYFASKEALVKAVFEQALGEIGRRRRYIADDPSLSATEKLRRLLTVRPREYAEANVQVSQDIRRHMPEIWRWAEREMDVQWRMIETVIQRGIDAGEFRDVRVPVLRRMFRSGCDSMLEHHFLQRHTLRFTDVVEEMTEIILQGIGQAKAADGCGRNGRTYFNKGEEQKRC